MTIPNPGWYSDPENGRQDRWWNGVSWSEQRKVRAADGAGLPGSGADIPPISHITNATYATNAADLRANTAATARSWVTGSTAGPPPLGQRVPDAHSPIPGRAAASRRDKNPSMPGLALSLGSLVFNPYGVLGILGVLFSAVGLAKSGHPLNSGVGVARNAVAIAGLAIGGLVTAGHAVRFLAGLA